MLANRPTEQERTPEETSAPMSTGGHASGKALLPIHL